MFQATFLCVSLLLGDDFLQDHTAGLSGFSIAGVPAWCVPGLRGGQQHFVMEGRVRERCFLLPCSVELPPRISFADSEGQWVGGVIHRGPGSGAPRLLR